MDSQSHLDLDDGRGHPCPYCGKILPDALYGPREYCCDPRPPSGMGFIRYARERALERSLVTRNGDMTPAGT